MAGVLEYSTTPASNTTVNGIGIAGSNSVKNGDDALRQLMADTASAITKVVDKTGSYTALKTDFNQMIRATGTLTLNLTAAATLTSGWSLWVKGDGGAITVDPNGSEQINGATTLVVADGSSARIICTGTAFRAVVGAGSAELQALFGAAPWIPVNNGSAVTVDFDTITTPGWNNRLLTDDGTVHGPGVASRFYYVQVIETASGNLIQEAYPYRVGTEKKYIRTRFSGSWTAWKQEAYLDDVLPLTGGTLTGAVSGITPTNAAHLTRKDYVDGQDIGIGQSWQAPTRNTATVYQNTTGKPIMVNVSPNGSTGAGNFEVSPDNSTWTTVGIIYSNAQDVRSAEAIVPAGHYYRLSAGAGIWRELR